MASENRGGARIGAGRTPLKDGEKKKGFKVYMTEAVRSEILQYGDGKNFSDKVMEIISSELENRKNKM